MRAPPNKRHKLAMPLDDSKWSLSAAGCSGIPCYSCRERKRCKVPRMNGIVNAIFQTAVTPELLEKAVAMLAELEPDDRKDLTGRAVTIVRMLDE